MGFYLSSSILGFAAFVTVVELAYTGGLNPSALLAGVESSNLSSDTKLNIGGEPVVGNGYLKLAFNAIQLRHSAS